MREWVVEEWVRTADKLSCLWIEVVNLLWVTLQSIRNAGEAVRNTFPPFRLLIHKNQPLIHSCRGLPTPSTHPVPS
jgi:hypothetical protein